MSKAAEVKPFKPKTEDFVDLFVDFYKEYESPNSFWKWAAYSMIGSMLRNRVYFQHGNLKIYPNMYVVFLADSAQYRKGQPIEVARRILTLTAHTKLFSGTASIQAILDMLAIDEANKITGIPTRGGSCLLTADELAAFFVDDPRLLPLLTDIWTPRDLYEYRLRSTNSIKIKDLCVSLLAASNETFLREVYDSRAVYGGLLGRTFLIKPDEVRPGNSLMDEPVHEIQDESPLVNFLIKLKSLEGRVRFTKEAVRVYNLWYMDLYENKYKSNPDKTGVLQRMHSQVLKLAIILAASTLTLEVSKEIMENSILEVTDLKSNYEIYSMGAGSSSLSHVGRLLLATMWDKKDHRITRKEFLMKNWSEVTSEDLDKLIQTLLQGGMLSLCVLGQEVAYELTSKCLETMKAKK